MPFRYVKGSDGRCIMPEVGDSQILYQYNGTNSYAGHGRTDQEGLGERIRGPVVRPATCMVPRRVFGALAADDVCRRPVQDGRMEWNNCNLLANLRCFASLPPYCEDDLSVVRSQLLMIPKPLPASLSHDSHPRLGA
jgi:hypothetical protein